MKTLVFKQFLPISLEQAWDFFSSPKNLNEITPANMHFQIKYLSEAKMYQGMLIHYKISPFLNIPMNWVTKITDVVGHEYFIDEQLQGPYKLWHHEHHFKAVEGGVEMTDVLHYDIGMSVLGSIAGAIFVHRQVRGIFEYRKTKLEELFGN